MNLKRIGVASILVLLGAAGVVFWFATGVVGTAFDDVACLGIALVIIGIGMFFHRSKARAKRA